MQSSVWPIDFSFHYPRDCTPDALVARLMGLAADWRGWDYFPWCVTRNIHRFVDSPPVNFHYLLLQRCTTTYAAHTILEHDFEDRDELLEMLIREQFQFAGVFRLMLIDALRFEMRALRQPYILDCTGPEDGHTNVPTEELCERRRRFQACVEAAKHDYARILNTASLAESMSERVLGNELQVWARGVDMPAPEVIAVQVDDSNGKRVLRPNRREATRITKSGKRVPRIVIERHSRRRGTARGGSQEARPAKPTPRPVGPTTQDGQTRRGTAEGTAADAKPSAQPGDVATSGGESCRLRVNVTVDAEGLGGGGPRNAEYGPRQQDIAELRSHLDERLDDVDRDVNALKVENEALREREATALTQIADEVDPQFFYWIFVILGTGSVSKAARLLDIPNSTLSVKLKRYAERGGAYDRLYRAIDVRRRMGMKGVERFNEVFAKHQQGSVRDHDVLRDLLEGLEALNGRNWQSVRRELMALIEEADR